MEKVTVTIQITKSFEITEAERKLVVDLLHTNISAILFIKNQYGLSLAEASQICDKIWESRS